MAKSKRGARCSSTGSRTLRTRPRSPSTRCAPRAQRPFVSLPVTWEEIAAAQEDKTSESFSFEPDAPAEEARGSLFRSPTLTQTLPDAFTGIGQPPRTRTSATTRTLATYRERWNFVETPKPARVDPQRARPGGRRRFVVQKHGARRLYYDFFGLEMHGILKCWAVPKGIPGAPGEMRTALETEDHPTPTLPSGSRRNAPRFQSQ
jgi:hypothetical protein